MRRRLMILALAGILPFLTCGKGHPLSASSVTLSHITVQNLKFAAYAGSPYSTVDVDTWAAVGNYALQTDNGGGSNLFDFICPIRLQRTGAIDIFSASLRIIPDVSTTDSTTIAIINAFPAHIYIVQEIKSCGGDGTRDWGGCSGAGMVFLAQQFLDAISLTHEYGHGKGIGYDRGERSGTVSGFNTAWQRWIMYAGADAGVATFTDRTECGCFQGGCVGGRYGSPKIRGYPDLPPKDRYLVTLGTAATPGLSRILNDRKQIRFHKAAAYYLGRLGLDLGSDSEATKVLSDFVLQQITLKKDIGQDLDAVGNALMSLGLIGDDKAIPLLEEIAIGRSIRVQVLCWDGSIGQQGARESVIKSAIRGLGITGSPKAKQALEKLKANPPKDVMWVGADIDYALRDIGQIQKAGKVGFYIDGHAAFERLRRREPSR